MDGSATSAKRAAMLLLLDSDSSASESSSTDTSDSSDSDSDAKAYAYEREFNKLFRNPAKRPNVVGFIEDFARQYSDHEFRRHLRLARPVAVMLVAEFAVSSMCPLSTHGGFQAKTAEMHVLTFIWYAANKTCMRDVASRFDMSDSTMYRVLQRVAQFLMTLAPSVTKFPADLETLTCSFEKRIDYGGEEPDDDNDDDVAPNAIQWENCADNHSDKTDEERALNKLGEINRAKVLTKLLRSDCGK
ncbi:hypothetical protein HPB51_010311 [Rhipicephalus microplus]|uniref:Nuclease HARBI1 n=1 Tax=Rhipicephalus microplus TaxID=6941 RepID=A0A9J6D4X0_RHIMP|nr:hypothetical protein HPB51_010311 [Rhipicephalus microplus]